VPFLGTSIRFVDLELEPSFTGGIGQSLHTTMILETTAVEDHLGNPSGLGLGCNERPHRARLIALGTRGTICFA
jgi:hypothetical protein